MNRPNPVALFRILDTKRRIQLQMWLARREVIREQLRSQRGRIWA